MEVVSMVRAAIVWALLLLAGCAVVTPPPARDAALAECRQLFRNVDRAVAAAGVRDHGPFPVSGFPYLRIDRFHASFRDEVDDPLRFSDWVRQLTALDAGARAFELQNLPAATAKRFGSSVEARLNNCRARLIDADLAAPARRSLLRRQAVAPGDYLDWQRVVGLYPLTALFVSSRVAQWQKESRDTFATPLARLPLAGTLVRWGAPRGDPLTTAEVRTILQRATGPLGIPKPTAAELDRLFATFAPLWEVDVADDNDLIGSPAWKNGGLTVDTDRPAVFRKLSYTRFRGRVLLQLNYIVWFPARTGDDIYAGRFDGIDFRVTLGPDGEPWLYDAMHNCGCYHTFFPSRHLRLRSNSGDPYFEPPLVAQAAPAGRLLVLRISHRTHYIERLRTDADAQPVQPLAWRDYDALRSLPASAEHRSMFGPGGIVPGSERPERFILWPTGVRSAGAMRQWGRHATAFVGQRHFDDPFLIESLFEAAAP